MKKTILILTLVFPLLLVSLISANVSKNGNNPDFVLDVISYESTTSLGDTFSVSYRCTNNTSAPLERIQVSISHDDSSSTSRRGGKDYALYFPSVSASFSSGTTPTPTYRRLSLATDLTVAEYGRSLDVGETITVTWQVQVNDLLPGESIGVYPYCGGYIDGVDMEQSTSFGFTLTNPAPAEETDPIDGPEDKPVTTPKSTPTKETNSEKPDDESDAGEETQTEALVLTLSEEVRNLGAIEEAYIELPGTVNKLNTVIQFYLNDELVKEVILNEQLEFNEYLSLKEGQNTVKVIAKNSEEQVEDSFEISSTPTTASEDESQNEDGRKISMLLVVCLVFCLPLFVAIPAVAYLIWKRRKGKKAQK